MLRVLSRMSPRTVGIASALPSSSSRLAGGALLTQPMRTKIYKAPKKKKQGAPRKDRRIAVILMEDVEHVGVQGEEVRLKRGHARNVLLCHNRAVYASPQNIRKYKTVFALDEDGGEEDKLQKIAIAHLTNVPLVLLKRSAHEDNQEQLHEPINTAILHHKLMNTGLPWLFEEQIVLTTPVSEFGTSSFGIDLSKGLMPLAHATVQMKLVVQRWLPQDEYADSKPSRAVATQKMAK